MLNSCQQAALELLQTTQNVFLTGVAGSGKSFLIRHFLRDRSPKEFPVLASTGAAAILVGGRTFHSFFGLGIMQGGYDATIERALRDKKVVRRLKKTAAIVIDEVSMLSGATISAAECIARLARDSDKPWGGLRVIAVGDFAQLPPVTPYDGVRDWAFMDAAWEKSNFAPAVLRTIVRTEDHEFLSVLNEVRNGQVTEKVAGFLDSRTLESDLEDFEGTRLFPRRDQSELFNLQKLEGIPGRKYSFATEYTGTEKFVQDLKRNAPVPEVLHLKEGALVMLRQNDPQGRWVNGSLAQVRAISSNSANAELALTLLEGLNINIEQTTFSILNAEGQEVASARNFPVNLAYATTIHKAQGMTLDRVMVDLRNLWEPGQAYVALSRVKTPSGLHLTGWTPRSIKTDPKVAEFNAKIWGNA